MPGKCLICEAEIEPFHSFGKMPIANGFLSPGEFEKEYYFELKVGWCSKCYMFQLTELVDRERMFHENYAFFSSTSKLMAVHFEEFANQVQKKYLKASSDPLVVEIGCNDGIMLQHFARQKIRHVGVDPSKNVAEIARSKGVNAVCGFFDEKMAKQIVAEHGHADAFLAANVMCHIPYFHSILKGIDILIKKDGVVIFEDPYLLDVIEKTSYDQIYDEHCFLFSLHSIKFIFDQYGMEIVDIDHQETHGGSMRYVIARKGARQVAEGVHLQFEKEKKAGLDRFDTFLKFRENCEKSKSELRTLLEKIRNAGKRVVGYAATSKSTTVLNYCGITPNQIEFISDTTPIKQGKYSPGSHIPVLPYERFKESYPDYALLFGWNHSKEIFAKEQDFRKAGGQWIVYVPRVEVVSS